MSDSIKYVTAGVVCHKCKGSMFEGYWDISQDVRIDAGSTVVASGVVPLRGDQASSGPVEPNPRFLDYNSVHYRQFGNPPIIPPHISRSSLSPFAPTGRRSHRSLKCVQCSAQQEIKR
jgi:hypothetical protein